MIFTVAASTVTPWSEGPADQRGGWGLVEAANGAAGRPAVFQLIARHRLGALALVLGLCATHQSAHVVAFVPTSQAEHCHRPSRKPNSATATPPPSNSAQQQED